MAEHDIPKGVSLDTLHEILVGWSDAGAADEPRYTADVEALTSVSDAVGRQTRFLEELGVLDPHKQRHELTDAGQDLAGALADGDEERARATARDLLSDWGLTDDVRGILDDNPMDRDELVPLVAELAGQDIDTSRVETGLTTLLDLYEWAGALERDAEGRYRLPDPDEDATADEEASVELSRADGTVRIDVDSGPGITISVNGDGAAEAGESEEEESAESGGEADEAADRGDSADVSAAADPENTADLAELAEAHSTPDLVAEIAAAATDAREAADEATVATEAARTAADEASSGDAAGGDTQPSETHTISLDLDIDPEDLEAIVRALRAGLTDEE